MKLMKADLEKIVERYNNDADTQLSQYNCIELVRAHLEALEVIEYYKNEDSWHTFVREVRGVKEYLAHTVIQMRQKAIEYLATHGGAI